MYDLFNMEKRVSHAEVRRQRIRTVIDQRAVLNLRSTADVKFHASAWPGL